MAVTKIKGIKVTVEKAIDYIVNPEKTDGKILVSGFQVVPAFAAYEFKATADLAQDLNGDYTNTGSANVQAYHLMQSFSKKDAISPDQAHEVGKRFADEVLQGKHEYVLTTHIDKGHIHNHIIFNAVSYLDHKKFRSEPYKTVAKLREVSDRLCAEFGLDVIGQPEGQGLSYKEWQENKWGSSWKEQIRKAVEEALLAAEDYQAFLVLMRKRNIEVKEGVHLAFRLKGQERFVRGKTIGERYTREGIQAVLTRKAEKGEKTATRIANTPVRGLSQARRAPMSPEMWATYERRRQKLQETKELARIVLILRQEGIRRLPDIDVKLGTLRTMVVNLKENAKRLEQKNLRYKEAAKHLRGYMKLLPIWEEYNGKRGRAQKIFYGIHERDIRAFEFIQAQLQISDVSSSVDPDKVMGLIQHLTDQVQSVRKQSDEIESRVQFLQEAQKKVQETLSGSSRNSTDRVEARRRRESPSR
jgi:hypothetical protein